MSPNKLLLTFFYMFFIYSCNKENNYESFLGKPSEDSETIESKAINKDDDKKLKKYEKVTISEEVLDKYIKEIAGLKAKIEMIEISNDAKNKESFAEGLNSCKEQQNKEKQDVKDKILRESESVIKVLKEKLTLYKMPNVIVNGECIGVDTNGEKFLYTLTDACLNIISKKVGNEGEIVGIIGGISKESIKAGIISLDCEAGRSHMKFVNNSCLSSESFLGSKIEKN